MSLLSGLRYNYILNGYIFYSYFELYSTVVNGNFGFTTEYVNQLSKLQSLESILKGSGVKLPFKRSKDSGSKGAGFRFSCFDRDKSR